MPPYLYPRTGRHANSKLSSIVQTKALEAQHTGDELQRRRDFARSVKNMNEKDAQRARAAEKERQRKWDDEYKKARQQQRSQ